MIVGIILYYDYPTEHFFLLKGPVRPFSPTASGH